jgi:hypothetical protein
MYEVYVILGRLQDLQALEMRADYVKNIPIPIQSIGLLWKLWAPFIKIW